MKVVAWLCPPADRDRRACGAGDRQRAADRDLDPRGVAPGGLAVGRSDLHRRAGGDRQRRPAGYGDVALHDVRAASRGPGLVDDVAAGDDRVGSGAPGGGGDQGGLPYVSDQTVGLHGTLWTTTALAVAASPYAVAGDLTVAPGVTLTIPAGVTLTFAATDVMGAGANTSRAELQVAGTLIADATPAAPIVLAAASATAGSWYGVDLLPTAAGSVLDNLQISYPIYGLTHRATGANTLTSITVTSASIAGLYATAGLATVDGLGRQHQPRRAPGRR